FRKLKKIRQLPQPIKFALLIVPLFTILTVFVINTEKPIIAGIKENYTPTDAPNNPMGSGIGIHPGRVAWIYEPEATLWDGSTGKWWEAENTDYDMVYKMLEGAVIQLTGEQDISSAWDAAFTWFNQEHEKEGGYQDGEKIAVKLNLNNTNNHTSFDNRSNSSPQMVLALAKQLVEVLGVPESAITFYDISRPMAGPIYNAVHNVFPDISFVDNIGGDGREKFVVDYSSELRWSEEERTIEIGGGYPTYLPVCVSEADYLINLGNLKGHNLAGVTICAKNHFGTYYSYSESNPTHSPPKAAGVHPYITVHDMHSGTHWNFDMREMGTYNALVDIMGHEHLGGKTLLFLVDGLYASRNQYESLSSANMWESPPFNGGWTASVFASFDGVAIESVAVDFLRSEPTMNEVYGNVDNYLHEAAQAGNPPSGMVYDPEGDGTVLASLGVHEHWNNAEEKKYSRNLGFDYGIELVSAGIPGTIIKAPKGLQAYPDYDNKNILLLWSEQAAGALEYTIERAENTTVEFIELGTIESSKTFYLDKNIETNVQYFYRMRSTGMYGTGEPGDTVSALVLVSKTLLVEDLVLYPNPANDFVTISLQNNSGSIDEIGIYTLQGRLVKRISKVANNNEFQINITDLSSGQYLLKCNIGGGEVTRMLIKE
ncbi:MAG: T9SS type A sorting domain-containing protein, partial [Bacteroidales bacterium]